MNDQSKCWPVLLILTFVVGCSWDMCNRASPGLTIDPGNLGTGQPVVSPANNARFWNGEPLDLRGR
jgi:hypothetical protein